VKVANADLDLAFVSLANFSKFSC